MSDVISLHKQPPSGPFRTGDIVCLKSGSPSMTVRRVTKTKSETTIFVDWFNEAGDLQTADFPSSMITEPEIDVDVEIEPTPAND